MDVRVAREFVLALLFQKWLANVRQERRRLSTMTNIEI